MFGKKKKTKTKELVRVETEEQFHAALNRGDDLELTRELAEQIGVPINEDVGTVEEIEAARYDPHD